MAYKKQLTFLLLFLLLFTIACQNKTNNNLALDDKFSYTKTDNQKNLVIYYFWSENCDQCNILNPILLDINKTHNNVVLWDYNIDNQKNFEFYIQVLEKNNLDAKGIIPLIFIGNKHWTGYNEDIKNQIINCINNDC
jgi:thiol-disulfide isomerase/thioredoxin